MALLRGETLVDALMRVSIILISSTGTVTGMGRGGATGGGGERGEGVEEKREWGGGVQLNLPIKEDESQVKHNMLIEMCWLIKAIERRVGVL